MHLGGATPTMDEPGAESGMNGEAIPIVEVGTSIGVRQGFIALIRRISIVSRRYQSKVDKL